MQVGPHPGDLHIHPPFLCKLSPERGGAPSSPLHYPPSGGQAGGAGVHVRELSSVCEVVSRPESGRPGVSIEATLVT